MWAKKIQFKKRKEEEIKEKHVVLKLTSEKNFWKTI